MESSAPRRALSFVPSRRPRHPGASSRPGHASAHIRFDLCAWLSQLKVRGPEAGQDALVVGDRCVRAAEARAAEISTQWHVAWRGAAFLRWSSMPFRYGRDRPDRPSKRPHHDAPMNAMVFRVLLSSSDPAHIERPQVSGFRATRKSSITHGSGVRPGCG